MTVTDCNITDFKIEKIGQGKGFRSQAFRIFNIQYENNEKFPGNFISSFIFKFVDLTKYPEEKLEWNFCVAEKGFYEHISHTWHVPRVPKCYFAYEKERISCLMLEDFPQHNYTFASGVPISMFIEMTRSLAEMHAMYWGASFFSV